MSKKAWTVGIVGGGACGLFAAVALGRRMEHRRRDVQIVIFEKMPRVGKKLLATGNGRCNLTNIYADQNGYFGDPAFARRVLCRYPVAKTLALWKGLGLLCKEETQGRVYPDCEQAASVLTVLLLECERLHVKIRTDYPVDRVEKQGSGYVISNGEENSFVDFLLLCCGGKAAPKLGSDGSGYALAQGLGHRVVPPFPALVQLRSKSKYPRQLKGVRKKCHIALELDGEMLEGTDGELLFTDYGLSGIAVMELSRVVSGALAEGTPRRVRAVIDLMPRYEAKELMEWLENRQAGNPELPAGQLLTGLLHNRLGLILMGQSGEAMDKPSRAISRAGLERIVTLLKHWFLIIDGTTGFAGAQVTAGGVDTAEVNPDTMESRRCPGLYFGGELLNVDGACGGYNLQWAWSSAQLAAECIADKIQGKTGGDHA